MNHVCIYFTIATPLQFVYGSKCTKQMHKSKMRTCTHKIYVYMYASLRAIAPPPHPTYSRSLITNKSELQNVHTHIHTRTHAQDTTEDKDASIEQPRRLSLRRRSSFKPVEIIQNESFIDIQLKPVAKVNVTPQKAQQSESKFTKVTDGASSQSTTNKSMPSITHFRSLSVSLTHTLCLFRSFLS